MSLDDISTEIDATLTESRALNAARWTPIQVQMALGGEKTVLEYRPQTPEIDHRCIELSERLERLYRFRSELIARQYSTGTHDWMGPEDFARHEH